MDEANAAPASVPRPASVPPRVSDSSSPSRGESPGRELSPPRASRSVIGSPVRPLLRLLFSHSMLPARGGPVTLKHTSCSGFSVCDACVKQRIVSCRHRDEGETVAHPGRCLASRGPRRRTTSSKASGCTSAVTHSRTSSCTCLTAGRSCRAARSRARSTSVAAARRPLLRAVTRLAPPRHQCVVTIARRFRQRTQMVGW